MAGCGRGEVPESTPLPAGIAPGARVELKIAALAYGGAGVARKEGFVVLVDRVLPGEEVQVEITQVSRRFARARLLAIGTPSPQRQDPPCPHDPLCGGCAYQALGYPLQLETKRAQVIELLQRIGKIDSPPVGAAIPSPIPFGYRRRMSYTLAAVEGVGGGLHQRADPSSVLEVSGCLLPEPNLQTAYVRLLPELRSLKLFERPRQMDLLSGSDSANPVALFRSDRWPTSEFRKLALEWVQRGGMVTGVLWLKQESARSRSARGKRLLLAGKGEVEETLEEFRVRIPAGSFFQANPPLAAKVFQGIARRCGAGRESILELYSGVGALTLFLAAYGRRVTAVEGNPDSVRAARDNLSLNGFHDVEWIQADVRDVMARWSREGTSFDIVVLDPPRTGLPREAAGQLSSLARKRILYLSCDPATLARDLREILGSGDWVLQEVVPVDFFPQTAGIESLAVLERS